MFLLMMMPMALYEAASISIDASSVSIALLLAALVWREAMEQNDKRVSWPVLVSFCLLSIGLGLTKFVYLPLIGLILLIPSRRFGGKWRRTAAFAIILFVGFAGEILWAVHTPGLDAALVPGSAPHQFVARGQLAFLRQHPSAWLSVPLKTIAESWWSVTVSFVGNLGWLNAPLSGIFCVIYLAALLLACVPSADEPKLETFGPWIAIIIAVIAVCLFAIGFTEYIYWNLVGWGYIRGLQGRYGIPLAPAAFMLIWVSWQRLPHKFWSHRTGWEREALCVLLAACGSVYALFVIYSRFYVG